MIPNATLPEPVAPGHWENIPCSLDGYYAYMALDRHRYCIIDADADAPPVGDRGEHLESYGRPDGLFEHIYGPGPRVKAIEKQLQDRLHATRFYATAPALSFRVAVKYGESVMDFGRAT